jgi:hypothetical protein
VAFAAQLALYGFAAIGWWLRETPIGRGRLFYIPYFFCFVNAAALVGIFSIMSGRKNAAWSAQRSVKISRP